jgi:hypothetical protein
MLDPTQAYVWSFLPNWAQSFRVTREYRTDIFTSRSKREFRRATRSTPRRSFDFEAIMQGDDLREFNAMMSGVGNKPFIMPDWTRTAVLSSASASGTSTLNFAALPSWAVAGRALFLRGGAQVRPTAVYVNSIAGSNVVLSAPLTATWPIGTTVMPGPVGLLDSELKVRNPVNNIGVVAVSFSVDPTSEPAEVPAAAAVTFNNREVCLLRPNWANDIDQTFIWPSESIDFKRGRVAEYFPFDFPSRLRRASFIAANVTESLEIEDILTRMKGQRGDFYMPTGENDLPPIASLTSGGSTLTVAGTFTDDHYSGSKVFKAICVVKRDGTRLYRNVTGIATSGSNSVLTVNTPWPSTITSAEVLMVSWMPVWRFASDTLAMEWVTNTVARADQTLRMLEDLTAETF